MSRRSVGPSPAFVATVVMFVLLFLCIGSCAQAAEPAKARAPIVERDGEVMVQTGWIDYDRADGEMLLFCVDSGTTTLDCLAGAVVDGGWVFGMVSVQATRIRM